LPIVSLQGEQLKLTNLTKVLWPKDNITKGDFIDYYAKIAPYILPHLKDRPMVFTRYPNGISGKAFYQKNVPDYAPDWLYTYEYKDSDNKVIKYVLINDKKSLLWAANQASIELHPWLSRVQTLDYPDFAIFDFDPMENSTFADVREVALALKQLLDIQGLEGFPKTSGATGLQVYVPLVSKYTYEQVRIFTKFFCQVLEKTFPDKTTTERSIEKRKGKIYLDYLQNIKGKTIIAPYSPRPIDGAPVSCPITWDELKKSIIPDMFNIKNMPNRLKQMGDIFEGVLSKKQNIDRQLEDIES
jgi:bifunctional non-homologous end joining protein LigD